MAPPPGAAIKREGATRQSARMLSTDRARAPRSLVRSVGEGAHRHFAAERGADRRRLPGQQLVLGGGPIREQGEGGARNVDARARRQGPRRPSHATPGPQGRRWPGRLRVALPPMRRKPGVRALWPPGPWRLRLSNENRLFCVRSTHPAHLDTLRRPQDDLISALLSTNYIPCFAGTMLYTFYRANPVVDGEGA